MRISAVTVDGKNPWGAAIRGLSGSETHAEVFVREAGCIEARLDADRPDRHVINVPNAPQEESRRATP